MDKRSIRVSRRARRVKGMRKKIRGTPDRPRMCVFRSLSHIYDEDYATAVRWLGDGRVLAEPLISARLPLDALVSEGLHRLENQPNETLKVIIRP